MSDWLLEVTDLKQYTFCPRIVFYRYCLPRIRPITYSMEEGIRSHEEEETREDNSRRVQTFRTESRFTLYTPIGSLCLTSGRSLGITCQSGLSLFDSLTKSRAGGNYATPTTKSHSNGRANKANSGERGHASSAKFVEALCNM